jgi:hypothetical protein
MCYVLLLECEAEGPVADGTSVYLNGGSAGGVNI